MAINCTNSIVTEALTEIDSVLESRFYWQEKLAEMKKGGSHPALDIV